MDDATLSKLILTGGEKSSDDSDVMNRLVSNVCLCVSYLICKCKFHITIKTQSVLEIWFQRDSMMMSFGRIRGGHHRILSSISFFFNSVLVLWALQVSVASFFSDELVFLLHDCVCLINNLKPFFCLCCDFFVRFLASTAKIKSRSFTFIYCLMMSNW